MNARILLLSASVIAASVAAVYHGSALQRRSRLEADRSLMLTEAADKRRATEDAKRQLAVAQDELHSLLTRRTGHPGSGDSSEPRMTAVAEGEALALAAKPARVPPDSELRGLQLRAFVSEQRLRFAALFRRLGFTEEQLQAFDRIQGSCQLVMLDDSQPDLTRRQARETRDAQLKELFGPHHGQWLEANRNQPARAIVDQIVQRTFQSSGALTTTQADEVTRIVAQHRISAARVAGAGAPGYDWDGIMDAARPILDPRQWTDFVTAIEFRRASDQMSAIAAKKKR